jgi:hypothetical protein
VRAADARAAARDADARRGLARIVNLYAWCSFDVGATLCEWLAAEAPATLAAMVRGDRAAVRRWGHGTAIAAPYHHVILPLASRRDKVTEVRWGIADFTRRFGRAPEGMWLPECAVDDETLDVLAAEGIHFTILGGHQLHGGGGDGGRPVRWVGSGGRTLVIVPYDGALAGEVAFGGLLRDADALARRLAWHASPDAAAAHDGPPRVTLLATDGETFGHHHRGGDETLARAVALVHRHPRARLASVGAIAATVPPAATVEVASPSSWSCAHGVERWRSDCGCRLDAQARTSQAWRTPLRLALEWLAARCHERFAHDGAALFRDDPWAVRDGYGAVVAEDGAALEAHVRTALRAPEDAAALARARALLEMERAVLRSFTSCAWFFDDVARIETRQVLRYAARALELSGMAARVAPPFTEALGMAASNDPAQGTAAELFVREAVPHHPAGSRAAAAAAALAAAGTPPTRVAAFDCAVAATPVDGAWTVVCSHRRTGAAERWQVTPAGVGPGASWLVAPLDDPTRGVHRLHVADLPEAAARTLLARHADLDDALAP